MKAVLIDSFTGYFDDLDWTAMFDACELSIYDCDTKDEDELIRRIGDAQIVIANKAHVTRRVIESCPGIKLITVMATGYDSIDCVCAKERGICVCNVPSYGTASVSQYAIAMLLEICGAVAHHSDAVHAGRWAKSDKWSFWDQPLIELDGKTMGIIGFGRIGQSVGRIARALGMNVIAYNHSRSEGGSLIADYAELDELLRRSDVISLHCPLSPATKGMINRENIAKMKDGVIIINNSRGGLVIEQDLADALNSGKVRAAGLDVVSSEPIRDDNPLLHAKNCLITPHISWAPVESRQRILDCTEQNIRAFMAGSPQNTVHS